MRYFFLIAVILARFTAFGQPIERFNVPDFALVEKETHDANGAYYYPRLMNRYRNDDTLLTLKDFYMLYYGVFSAPDNREMAVDLSDLYDTVRAINGKDSVTERDRTALLGSYLKLSENSPFELRYLNAIYNLYEYRHDPAAEYYRFRLRMILEVITETGDGKTRESGFYVNSVSDEYSILGIYGFESNGTQALVDNCDYLQLKANKYNLEGMYFNVEKIMERMYGKLRDAGNPEPKQ